MHQTEKLSPWWRQAVILTMVAGFTILIWLAVRSFKDAPPIPHQVVSAAGETVITNFTKDDVLAGQQVFLKHALMENGTIWGHGAYLGPDFSAEYLHTLARDAQEWFATNHHQRAWSTLSPADRDAVEAEVVHLLKQNRYEAKSGTLTFTEPERLSFQRQITKWAAYLSQPANNAGLPAKYITDATELRQLTAFFAWTAWASAAHRPGKLYSYTNNFPYDPAAGNKLSTDAILWSALSLVSLLGGTAFALFAFGKFDYLGWKNSSDHVRPPMPVGTATASQRATLKYFVIVALLFLLQALVGAATAHYRVEPGGFYGFDLPRWLPSHLLRTWHLQLAIFWIATAYVAGGLFLAASLGTEPKGQIKGINVLFGALLIVVLGSLLGEILGINQTLGKLWFWFGHQGWEYLDLGRAWQVLLVAGLVLWLFLLFRAIAPVRQDPEKGEVSSLFLYAAVGIPLFYLPAMFFGSTTHFTVVDMWRFWIVHLWVEGFFELFATVMVAIIFFQLGVVSKLTAARVVYLDAILYLGSGIVGTGHHWYWTGQSNITMALAAMFSALEVVPLTLLTLDAWDFIRLTRGKCATCGKDLARKHKWTFYFLMAVGFWNFLGAGVFGFLINLPIVSYYEVGTLLTTNHGHAAMMGVFGMLAVALMVFALRQTLLDVAWRRVEKYVRISFWGLNIGLALMVLLNLFPGGIVQLRDVLENGYWHARSLEFIGQPLMRTLEWLRLPGDAIFILAGVVPTVLAAVTAWRFRNESAGATANK
jgi:nitric oxide reductase subunit B